MGNKVVLVCVSENRIGRMGRMIRNALTDEGIDEASIVSTSGPIGLNYALGSEIAMMFIAEPLDRDSGIDILASASGVRRKLQIPNFPSCLVVDGNRIDPFEAEKALEDNELNLVTVLHPETTYAELRNIVRAMEEGKRLVFVPGLGCRRYIDPGTI